MTHVHRGGRAGQYLVFKVGVPPDARIGGARYHKAMNQPNWTKAGTLDITRLTGVEQHLAESIERARTHNRLCALLFIDLDGFRAVNDGLGESAGNELLAAVGARLSHLVGNGGTVAHIGGDEFIVILDDLASNHDAHSGARKVLEIFSQPFALAGTRREIAASIGVSIYPFTAQTPEALVCAADSAMYAVKHNGGHGFEAARPQVPARDARKVHAACAISSAANVHYALAESG